VRISLFDLLSPHERTGKHNVGKLIFLSSGGTVYGDIGDSLSIDESQRVRPICSYGVSKLSIEHYLSVYQHLHGLNYVALRLSNPYGERQDPHRALGAVTVFLHRTLREETIEVWGDGGVTRDFIYAGDVANAVYLTTAKPVKGIFNVGTGVGTSLRDLLADISKAVSTEPKVVWLKGRPFDVPRVVLDCTKLQQATGWKCTTGLSEGIQATAVWLRKLDV